MDVRLKWSVSNLHHSWKERKKENYRDLFFSVRKSMNPESVVLSSDNDADVSLERAVASH